MASSGNNGVRAFLRENGWFLTLGRVVRVLRSRVRNRLLQRRIGGQGLAVGESAFIVGVGCMRIGRNFVTGKSLWLEAVTHFAGEELSPLLTIGDDCNFSDNVHIACTHRVTLGSGVLSGSNVIISDHTHGLYRGNEQSSPELRPVLRPLSRDGIVVIGNNVWLGDGVAVLAGAEIGDGCIIGANSVVNRPLPPRTICVGAPARPVRQWSEAEKAWVAL